MTPREFQIHIKAHKKKKKEKKKEKRDELLYLAWHTMVLQRVEKFPEFEEFIKDPTEEKPKKAQTEAEMLSSIKAITAMFGGNVTNK
jgi:hypothetical protein